MHIVVEASMVVEASWLPELTHIVPCMVVVQHELRQVANCEESDPVGGQASVDGLEVGALLLLALVPEDLIEAV